MTSLHFHVQARATTDVPWDTVREKRVLRRALDARRRRARRKFFFELAAAMALTFVAGRLLPRAAVDDGEARPALAVPATELDAAHDLTVPHAGSATKRTKSGPLGGFAGTGGHGGTGSTGQGGSAGTG